MIHTTGITKSFGSLQVLKGIDLTISKGEFVSIIGASGAGKTTLLQIIGSLDKADEGELIVDGIVLNRLSDKELAAFRNQHIGFVFQFHQLLPEFTALENVCIPALIAGVKSKDAEKRGKELLTQMGLSARMQHKPGELSGGEKQRVAVARALMNQPSLILADEPSGSLDSANKKELHSLLRKLCNEYGLTVLLVTHDKELADVSDRVIEMKDGMIVSATTK
ncbi:MAG: ABC transporter ATP-binding protein [Paludibacteraceae bacterium]|nr:ABC transporter ATP-binding protein [Paludibacteraceae bacterium]